MATLQRVLQEAVREGELYEKLERGFVRCYACGHCCRIPDGQLGVCKVRYNQGGKLLVPWGYVAGAQCDPIEKKPFFHAYPGALAYSFGMMGCDLHCGYCQNWVTSQALRDPSAVSPPLRATAEGLVREALEHGAKVVVSTYNEPLITSEWAVAVFKEARAAGLTTGYVSNGNATPQVLEYLRPWVDLYKVDLKSFEDRHYRQLGVTLIVPGFNDSDDELKRMAEFLAGVSPDIPWHLTAFHRDYKMTEPEDTSSRTLVRAAGIGKAAGLRFVYAGNLPGRTGELENTCCPDCHELLVERVGYHVLDYRLTATGSCPGCGAAIPGRWGASFQGQITDLPYLPGSSIFDRIRPGRR